ncbi:MAG: homoserine kinase [Chloroflexi bacterium]|nr:MAG: homoserine kinase [Chloroflexota bacterium]
MEGRRGGPRRIGRRDRRRDRRRDPGRVQLPRPLRGGLRRASLRGGDRRAAQARPRERPPRRVARRLRPYGQRYEGPRTSPLARRRRHRHGRGHTGRGARCVEVVAVGELRVRVPASSANLGPGFDSFAIALPLLAEFDLRPARAWSVSIDGGASDQDNGMENGTPTGEDNLFVVSARAAAEAAAETLGSYHVVQRSAIPVGRGLGSSAAAIVGGVVAANALMGEPLDRRTLLRVASEVEGHADNVAAALYGAFTVALPSDDGPVATRIAFPRSWRICLFIPREPLTTEKARAVLPANVSRADAVFNIAHAAALLAAVLRSDGALLSIAMADRLHQPARAQLVTGLNDIIAAARGAGAFGAALSGAGPAVVAFAPARLAARVVEAMEEAAHAVGTSGRGRVVRVRAAGAQVQRS